MKRTRDDFERASGQPPPPCHPPARLARNHPGRLSRLQAAPARAGFTRDRFGVVLGATDLGRKGHRCRRRTNASPAMASSDEAPGSGRCLRGVCLPQCNVEDHKNQNDEEADIKRSYYSLRCHNVPQSKKRSPPALPASKALTSLLRTTRCFRFLPIAASEARASDDKVAASWTIGRTLP